jgi:hypothetical protein
MKGRLERNGTKGNEANTMKQKTICKVKEENGERK